ncbi:exocyst complex component 2-like [Schistocerca gregaria]|uniref:exocyst complex component 2-like n=1 Tax=Schistocerca gregaria TaxID=7010 RepID=UPI00211F1472|nr:exocyst complex component 2-like [Schistocerca gregaria]
MPSLFSSQKKKGKAHSSVSNIHNSTSSAHSEAPDVNSEVSDVCSSLNTAANVSAKNVKPARNTESSASHDSSSSNSHLEFHDALNTADTRRLNRSDLETRTEPKRWSDVKDEEVAETDYLDRCDISTYWIDNEEKDKSIDDLSQYLQDMEDPLGIGTKTDGSQTPYLSKFNGGLSRDRVVKRKKTLDLISEEFEPITYLISVHRDTTIDNLLVGKRNLELKLASRQRQLEYLVKNKFSLFIACKDAIGSINAKMNADSTSAQIITYSEFIFSDLEKSSREIFSNLIERKNEIDRIRNALSILKRSQFFFHLPRQMRDNIEARQYGKVAACYKRIKSLTATISHTYARNVLAEVESIVSNLRTTLFELLEHPNTTLKEQEVIIMQLIDLNSSMDPAWFCISLCYKKMKSLLTEKLVNLNSPPVSDRYSSRSFDLSTSPIVQASQILQEHMPRFWHLFKLWSSNLPEISGDLVKNSAEHHTQEEFLELLEDIYHVYCDIVIKDFYGPFYTIEQVVELLNEMCKLLPNGSFTLFNEKKSFTKRKVDRHSSSHHSLTLSPFQKHEKMKNVKSDTPTTTYNFPKKFKDFIQQSVNDNDVDGSCFGKEIVLSIRNLQQCLSQILPEEYMEALSDLFDVILRTYIVKEVYDIFYKIRTWFTRETWAIANQNYMITSVPLKFECILKRLLNNFEAVIWKDHPLIILFQKSLVKCLNHFLENTFHLVFTEKVECGEEIATRLGRSVKSSTGIHATSEDARLIILLNNCYYVRTKIVPALVETFESKYNRTLFYDAKFRELQPIEQLEEMIKLRYICFETVALNSILNGGLLYSGFDWSGSSVLPSNIRDYVKVALLELVFIHDEVYRTSKKLVFTILSTLLMNMYQCFLDIHIYVDSISKFAALQIGIELEFIHNVMIKYRTPISNKMYFDLDQMLQYSSMMDPKSSDFTIKEKKEVKSIITSELNDTYLCYECFNHVDLPDTAVPTS